MNNIQLTAKRLNLCGLAPARTVPPLAVTIS
jgi:hypothetical protein